MKWGLILTVIPKVLFNLPAERAERLERVWVNDLVYSTAWRKFVSESAGVLQKMIWVSQTLRQCGK